MLRIHLLTALRNFKRNIVTSFINLIGLSLGLATVVIATLYIKHDLEADKFHEDRDLIFRTSMKIRDFYMTGTPYLFGEMLKKDHPVVIDALRTTDRELMVKVGEEHIRHKVLFADPTFLTFFTFPLAEGNRSKALDGLRQVVLSSEMKQKYFGDRPALGQTIKIELNNVLTDFEITGVAEPTPNYSSMYFEFLVPLENNVGLDESIRNDWDRFLFTTFLKVQGGNTEALDKAMPAFTQKHIPNLSGGTERTFVFHPYAKHHLGEGFSGGGMRNGKNAKSLQVFGAIAIIILLLACFNFMNLTNAQLSRRSLEVGIKKVVGAVRSQLIRQFLTESLLLTAMSAVFALGLAELGIIAFGSLIQNNISVFDKSNWDVFVGLAAITVITGILSGLYPAFVISGLNALKTFKKNLRIGGSNLITKSVLGLQFTLSIILIVCAIVMWKQQAYMMNKDLGYNKEQIVVVKINERDTARVQFLKNELTKIPEVLNASVTSTAFTGGSNVVHHTSPSGQSSFVYMMSVDKDFIPTMQMRMASGEPFSEEHAGREDVIMVNEKLADELGIADSIGVKLGTSIGHVQQPTITGVVENFHLSTLKHGIEPLMIMNGTRFGETYVLVRLDEGAVMVGLEKVRSIAEKTNPDSVFEFSFLDDNVANQYEEEIRWSSIITLATVIAIFLSVLGLLGLAIFTAEHRKKEIGIRKVLGATMPQLVALLSKGYVILIGIAFAVAIPLSFYIMNEYWLGNFAFRTSIDPIVYVIALVILLAIVAVSIGSLTIRAALQNPAETLKEE